MRRRCQALGALLAVLALMGCEGGDQRAATCDSNPAPAVVLRALPAPADTAIVDASVERMCARGVPGFQARAGKQSGEILIGSTAKPPIEDLLATAAPRRLALYDWEPNVYGNPNQPLVSLYTAVEMASKQKPRSEATDKPDDNANSRTGEQLYAFGPDQGLIRPGEAIVGDEAAKALHRNFFVSCAEIADDARAMQLKDPGPPVKGSACPDVELERGSRVIRVPNGVLVLTDAASQGYWVIEDDAELTGRDIVDPKQQLDPQTNEPIVTFEFTAEGRRTFARVTKRIAVRGAETLVPPGTPPESKFQRFAITIDGEVVSLATISYIDNPDGIDGSTGVQINGLGSLENTQRIARDLAAGELPSYMQVVRGP